MIVLGGIILVVIVIYSFVKLNRRRDNEQDNIDEDYNP